MVKATEKLIAAEKETIKSMIKYAVDEGGIDSLDAGGAILLSKFIDTVNAANEALMANARIMESMRSDLIEMKGKLDKVTK